MDPYLLLQQRKCLCFMTGCCYWAAGVLAAALALPHSALAGKTPDVGSYLPKSSKSQGLVDFKPDKNKTPVGCCTCSHQRLSPMASCHPLGYIQLFVSSC